MGGGIKILLFIKHLFCKIVYKGVKIVYSILNDGKIRQLLLKVFETHNDALWKQLNTNGEHHSPKLVY